MNKKELLKGLRTYEAWRKGAEIEPPTPKEVTKYIDGAISVIEVTGTKIVNKALYLKDIIDKIKITRGAMILDGYDEFDSCIKYMDELIKEIEAL